jgi:hypothetical protein
MTEFRSFVVFPISSSWRLTLTEIVIASEADARAALDLIVELYDVDPEGVMELRRVLSESYFWLKVERAVKTPGPRPPALRNDPQPLVPERRPTIRTI